MDYELVVFDMAGTTVRDPGLVAQALVDALAAAGVDVPAEAARPLMGIDKPQAIRALLRGHGAGERAAQPEFVAAVHADFVDRMIACYRDDPRVEAMPGAEAVFARLRTAGIRVALNTAFSRDIAGTIVERLGWARLIDDLVAADEVPQGRPAAHMIDLLRARAGNADATAVVKVGDTLVDVAEGRGAGAGLVVGVTTGANTRDELLDASPDVVIDDLRELPALLGA